MRGQLALAEIRPESRNGVVDHNLDIEEPIMCRSPQTGKPFHHHASISYVPTDNKICQP